MTDENGVRAAAERFRDALTQTAPTLNRANSQLQCLVDFPAGSCGDASELLAVYLEHCDLGSWQVVNGGSPNVGLGTHAWVEQDGMIVDITADQRGWSNPPVWITRDSRWHRQFSNPSRRDAQLPEHLEAVYLHARQIADTQSQ